MVNQIVVMEDITQGERVRKFELLGKKNGKWISLFEGSCIGHKFIYQFDEVELTEVKLLVKASIAKPIIRNLSVYSIE